MDIETKWLLYEMLEHAVKVPDSDLSEKVVLFLRGLLPLEELEFTHENLRKHATYKRYLEREKSRGLKEDVARRNALIQYRAFQLRGEMSLVAFQKALGGGLPPASQANRSRQRIRRPPTKKIQAIMRQTLEQIQTWRDLKNWKSSRRNAAKISVYDIPTMARDLLLFEREPSGPLKSEALELAGAIQNKLGGDRRKKTKRSPNPADRADGNRKQRGSRRSSA